MDVIVAVRVGVLVIVGESVIVGLRLGVDVRVEVDVRVAVRVTVGVSVFVGDCVNVGVRVIEGVGEGLINSLAATFGTLHAERPIPTIAIKQTIETRLVGFRLCVMRTSSDIDTIQGAGILGCLPTAGKTTLVMDTLITPSRGAMMQHPPDEGGHFQALCSTLISIFYTGVTPHSLLRALSKE